MTEQDSDFPEAWRPEPGDKIAGKVVSVTKSPDFGYGPYPIVTLVQPDGTERAVHAMHYTLRTELARRRVKRDDDLEISYQGKRAPKSGTGNDFHVYRVKGGDEPEFDWNSELPEDERTEASVPIQAAPTPSQVAQAQDAAATIPDDEVPF